jgi:hypothetical protein
MPLPTPILKPNQLIKDEFGRIGIIVLRWGGLVSCPECVLPVPPKKRTKCCNKRPITIDASNVYDIKYKDGKIRSKNICYLKPI